MATAKGHLDRRRKIIQPSSKNIIPKITDEEIAPTPESKLDDVFIDFLSADTKGTVYTDLTGVYPVTSRIGNKYMIESFINI